MRYQKQHATGLGGTASLILIGCISIILLLPALVQGQSGNPRIQALYQSGTFVEGPEFAREVAALKIRPIPNIEGSRYYIDEWLPGEVVLIDNTRTEELELKMDALQNQVHFQLEDQILGLNSKNVRRFHLDKDGKKILFKNGFRSSKAGIDPSTFLRVIHDGKIKLLAHHTADIRESHTSVIATAGSVSGEFVHRTNYYLKAPDGQLEKVRKLKRKHILRKLDHSKELKEYAEKNELDFSNENDLANTLTFYEQKFLK